MFATAPAEAASAGPLPKLLALARADFLERTRRYSFLVTMLFMIWGAYVFMPPNHARYSTFELGGHRGVYNSAWVGALVAVLASVFLPLAGFYLTKNTVERDRATGVGQILAATPLGRMQYAFGKALSNFAVLAVMLAAMAVAALGMQLVRGESRSIDLVALLMPFVLITLPSLAVTAALAVLFEVMRWTRGGLGNVLFFFLFMFMFGFTTAGLRDAPSVFDPLGKNILVSQIQSDCAGAFPEYLPKRDGMSMGFHFRSRNQIWNLKTFEWRGARWPLPDVAGRLIWMLVAVGLTAVAGLGFDRFDEARAAGKAKPARRVKRSAGEAAAPARESIFAPLARVTRATALAPLAGAEFALLARGQNRFWYFGALVLFVLSLALPLDAVRMPVLPLLWIWPVLIWSGMGSREKRNGTDGLLFSSLHPLRRQLPAQYLAGVAVAALLGAGVALRFALASDLSALCAWGVGALFIPAFALAAGVWSGGRKLFEILYLLLWYGGPMNRTPAIDYMGSTAAGAASATPPIFLAVTIALLILAALGRARQLRT